MVRGDLDEIAEIASATISGDLEFDHGYNQSLSLGRQRHIDAYEENRRLQKSQGIDVDRMPEYVEPDY